MVEKVCWCAPKACVSRGACTHL